MRLTKNFISGRFIHLENIEQSLKKLGELFSPVRGKYQKVQTRAESNEAVVARYLEAGVSLMLIYFWRPL